MVKWKCQGAHIEDGIAYPRDIGEEDEMPTNKARSLIISGQVEEVNPAPKIVDADRVKTKEIPRGAVEAKELPRDDDWEE